MTARWYRSGAVAVLALQVIDLATTAVVLHLGGYEANGLSAWLLERYLLVPAKLATAGFVVFAAFRLDRLLRPRDVVAIWLVVAVYTMVVCWNVSRVVAHTSY